MDGTIVTWLVRVLSVLRDTRFVWAIEGKALRLQVYYRIKEIQEDEAHRFRESRHTKVERLSAISTGFLYLHRKFLVLIFDRG